MVYPIAFDSAIHWREAEELVTAIEDNPLGGLQADVDTVAKVVKLVKALKAERLELPQSARTCHS